MKAEETREREGDKGVVSPARELPLLNGASSPANEQEVPLINNNSTNNNNNNTSTNNNNNPMLPNGLCGINIGLNNNVLSAGAPLNLNDVMKSPFRFDERSPFRFGEDPGCMVGRFGESLIPKGDPMEARLQEMLRSVPNPQFF